MNKKWCIHKRFSPVYTEILDSDFVSLAMYHGLADDFRSVFGQLRPYFFVSTPLILFKVPDAKVWVHQWVSWTCWPGGKMCLSPTAAHHNEGSFNFTGANSCHFLLQYFYCNSYCSFVVCNWSIYIRNLIFCIWNITWSLIAEAFWKKNLWYFWQMRQ